LGSSNLKSKLGLFFFSFLSFGVITALSSQINAQVEITIDREFTVNPAAEMVIQETETLRNRFTDRFIPKGSERKYIFVISAQTTEARAEVATKIYNSLNLRISDKIINYQRYQQAGQYGISYQLPQSINPGRSQTIVINYKHPELAEKSGGVVDAYIPAFEEDFQFTGDNTKSVYNTVLRLPTVAGPDNLVSITPSAKYVEGEFDVYEFDQKSLLGKFVWIQKGKEQIYKFSLVQPLGITSQRDNGNIDEYEMIFPRDIQELNVTQRVIFTNIQPEPLAVSVDKEGNLLATFRKAANQPMDAIIEGYAVLTTQRQDLTNSGKISEEPTKLAEYQKYIAPGQYWEADAAAITDFAQAQVGTQDDIYTTIITLYEAVVERIDYSQVKRFGLNERQGALQTLNGGAAVCMEYSDLYLSLLRNRGIAARAAFGYGYDSRLDAASQEPHQWIQVYLPAQNSWISVDVTWGESGPKVIGGDLNHFYTHLAATDPNSPPVLSRVSVGALSNTLEGPKFQIEVMDKLPEGVEENGLTAGQLLGKYPPLENSQQSFYLQALLQKLQASFRNLFSNPSAIDIQGWFLLGFIAISASALLVSLIRIILRLFAKPVEIKPRY